jgi:5-methylcytosine-specific restriction endonuclease McrA
MRDRGNAWYYDNIEQAREYRKQQYAQNREQAIEDARRWREENPERYRATMRRYKRKHYRENREAYRVYVRNRRARLAEVDGSHSVEDIETMYHQQNGLCHYCGASIEDGYHVDHVIPLSRGGSNSPDNLVLACPHCNLSKNDRLPSEWNPIPINSDD